MSDEEDTETRFGAIEQAIPGWVMAIIVLLCCIVMGFMTQAQKMEKNEYFVCSRGKEPQIYVSFEMAGNKSGYIHRRAECMLISEGRVGGLGSREMIQRMMRKEKGIILNEDDYVLPGLVDAHGHLFHYGELAMNVNLVGASSLQEIRDRIAGSSGDEGIIYGVGWDQNLFSKNGAYPKCEDLDDARYEGKKVVLKRIDEHAVWISCNLLDEIDVRPVEGGVVERRKNGSPTGVFVDNGMDLVYEQVPGWTDSEREKYLDAARREMYKNGLVGMHDAGLTAADIAFLRDKDIKKELGIRIYGMAAVNGMGAKNVQPGDIQKYDGPFLKVRACKIFLDGAIGSWGAAMLEPYSDKSDTRGTLIIEEPEFSAVVKAWRDAGFQVNSHGIGDRAVKMILDAYEKLMPPDGRFRIEHAQIMRPQDVPRLGKLGIIASVQPTHATSDMTYVERRIGHERMLGSYAWCSLVDGGAPIALGSDFPVESLDPRQGIHAATRRTRFDTGDSPHGPSGWYPEQRLTVDEALHGFTLGASYAAFDEKKSGTLSIGRNADFVVLNGDPLVRGGHVDVRATFIDGRRVYGDIGA